MSYEFRPPPLCPSSDLRACDDSQRNIVGGRLWCLQTIQQRLPHMKVVFSDKAQTDAAVKLAWCGDTVKAFVSQLSKSRYRTSEWCYTTRGRTPFAADSYVMGFNRHTGEENQRTNPWVYFKFSIMEKTDSILVFSCHPEQQYE